MFQESYARVCVYLYILETFELKRKEKERKNKENIALKIEETIFKEFVDYEKVNKRIRGVKHCKRLNR